MSLTQCTHPDAPFYELDLIGLSFAECLRLGYAMPNDDHSRCYKLGPNLGLPRRLGVLGHHQNNQEHD
jgi:hypothetical protein